MGVQTAADEAVDNAKDLLDDVESDISSVEELIEKALHRKTWGSESLNTAYREELANLLDTCRKFRRDINDWLRS